MQICCLLKDTDAGVNQHASTKLKAALAIGDIFFSVCRDDASLSIKHDVESLPYTGGRGT